MSRTPTITLSDNARVAIIGGGPAGSFTALHLQRWARLQDKHFDITIFEHRRKADRAAYTGCPQCAGGISPRLNEALEALDIALPPDVIQVNISSIILQGRWKHLQMPVPTDRKMLSVYRGSLPRTDASGHGAFDGLLLDTAIERGATLIGCRVKGATYDPSGRPVLHYTEAGDTKSHTCDFAVFAGGVNENPHSNPDKHSCTVLFQQLQPRHHPPSLRKALIFELEGIGSSLEPPIGELHFIESSESGLQLDMCSILPKRQFFTVSLIGGSVDRARSHADNLEVIHRFLALPQIRRTLPPGLQLRVRCACNPWIVVGTAKHAFGHRAAAVGDMATCRQYKDGILSAHSMARKLAAALAEEGLDQPSLQRGYQPVLRRFRRDNRYASVIFFFYRWFFTNRFLSRVIYQTWSSEHKRELKNKRNFARIFWAISSGDESYRRIAWWMLSPATLWQIFSSGFLVTIKTGFGESFFGLNWKGLRRFPVAVSREALDASRAQLLPGPRHQMEYMYRIDVRAPPAVVLNLLRDFGESNRVFLNPRWLRIRRTEGLPLQPGCAISYRVFGGLITFEIRQLPTSDPLEIRYAVEGGFAHEGTFIFHLEQKPRNQSRLSVILAFDYPQGTKLAERAFWRGFRLLFPEFIHEALWNHALCELKQAAEFIDLESQAEIAVKLTA